MAFSFPPFGQTSSSSTRFGSNPNESSSVFPENTSSPFAKGNSSSFGGFQNTTISGDSASTPTFGSPCSIFGVEPATSFGSSAVNSNSSTTSIFGESKPSTTPSLWSTSPSENKTFGPSLWATAASGNTSASGPSLWSTPASGNTSAFGVQSSSGGLSSSFFKTGDNQAKLFQFSFSSPLQAPTTPPLFPPFGSTSASENTSAFGVERPTGYVPRPFPSPFCSKTSTGNIFGPTASSTTTPRFSKPAPSFVQRPSSVFPSGPGLVTSSLSQPSQSSNGSTMFKEVGNQTINEQQQQSANPFGIQYEIDGPNAVITIQNGTSNIQISGEISSLTIRQVSSGHGRLPAREHIGGSSEPCFANSQGIFQGTTVSGVSQSNAHFGNEYRATPEIYANDGRITGQITSISAMPIYTDKSHEELRLKDYELQRGKGCEGKASFKLNVNEIEVNDEEEDDAAIKKREADVLALMPKLQDGDYYTEPSIKDLAAKEMAEPGFCSRVNDFVVGRKDYGSIKFLGETDIRHLDIESVVRFNNREVIVYPDDRKKPPLGQSLNKPAEVTLLNVKCISKKTGKAYVDGAQVQSYKEMLIKKASENGAEFVSYDPIQGEWKFRVPHF